MSLVGKLLDPSHVLIDLQASSKKRLFEQAGLLFATQRHLEILSELAQMFSDKALREAMSQAADAGALHQLVTAWQPDAAGQRRAAA